MSRGHAQPNRMLRWRLMRRMALYLRQVMPYLSSNTLKSPRDVEISLFLIVYSLPTAPHALIRVIVSITILFCSSGSNFQRRGASNATYNTLAKKPVTENSSR